MILSEVSREENIHYGIPALGRLSDLEDETGSRVQVSRARV